MIEPDLLAWPQAHVRLALLDDRTGPGADRRPEPPRAWSCSSPPAPVDRPPRGLGRTPGGCLLVMPGELPGRRAVLEVAGCQGYVGGRTGGARRDGGGREAPRDARPRAAADRAARRSPTAAPRARAGASWRCAASPRCSGCRCSSRSRAAAPGTRCSPPRRRSSGCSPPACCAGAPRIAAATLVAVGALALALLAGGVADELLRPDRWGDLAAGDRPRPVRAAGRARPVPRPRRVDADRDHRSAARCSRRSPRSPRSGRAGTGSARTRRARPAGRRCTSSPPSRSTSSASSSAARCWRCWSSRTCGWSGCGSATPARPRCSPSRSTILGLAAAPALDTDEPWFDYETWALSNASSKSTASRWEHSYGPLDWPRDGREMLRVKARRRRAYWKAMNLDDFDGARWVRDRGGGQHRRLRPAGRPCATAGCSSIEVSVRNLRSQTFVTAGIACSVEARGCRGCRSATGPTRPRPARCAAATPTRRSSTRRRPTERERRAAGRPAVRAGALDPHRVARRATPGALDLQASLGHVVQFPLFADGGPPVDLRAAEPGRIPRPAMNAPRAQRLRAHLGAVAAAAARRARRRRTTSRPSSATCAAAASPTPSRRRPPRRTSTASCSTPRAATASSSPGRWRCCCAWAACPPACRPASPRAPTTARRRSTWSATSTPTRGSRPGTPASAG